MLNPYNWMNQDEEIIWNSIQQKDTKAFEEYYKAHYKSFFLMACKYLKEGTLAEEIVNDVFMKLWLEGEKIRIESSLKSYIYKAVINRCINALSRQKKDLQNKKELAYMPEEAYELKQMEENELKIRLYSAIDGLPPQCQKVFRMSRFEGLKQREIADKLEISIKTVKNHITYALKKLSAIAENPVILLALILKEVFCGFL